MRPIPFLFLLPLFLGACSDDSLPKYVELKDLRVLAIQAGTSGGAAEFSPGDSVTITPYISDYYGGSRALTYEAFACINLALSVGGEPSCTGIPGAISVGSGSAAAPAISRTGSTTTFSVTIPTYILQGRSARDSYNGVSYLVTYTITAAGGPTVRAFTRLVVSESSKTVKNNNPQTTDLLANGTTLSSLPSGAVNLSVSYPSSSIESYDLIQTDLSLQNRTEELLTTWFITDGDLKFFRTINTNTTEYTPPSSAPSGRQPLIVGVSRDNRGGVTVIVKSL
jgi:hypothetical protein